MHYIVAIAILIGISLNYLGLLYLRCIVMKYINYSSHYKFWIGPNHVKIPYSSKSNMFIIIWFVGF